MQWYITQNGATVGPHDGEALFAKIRELVASGQSLAGAHVRDDGGSAWVPIEQSPFAAALAPRAAPAAPAKAKASWLKPTKGAIVGGAFVVFIVLAKCGIDSRAREKGKAQSELVASQAQAAAALAAANRPAAVQRTVAAVAEPIPDLSKRPSIPGSRATFRSWFQRLGVKFERSALADGTPREMGHQGLLIVEAIGYGDLLERASVTFGVGKDDMESAAAATGAILVFMRETGWEKGGTWVTTTMQKPKGGSTTKNGVRYELMTIMPGMFNLSAKPAASAQP